MTDRKRLPNRRTGHRATLRCDPYDVILQAGEYPDGTLGEIFLEVAKDGTFAKDILNAFAIAVSIGLQHGVTLEAFLHTYRNFNMEPDIVRAVFQELEQHYHANKEQS